MQQIPFRGHRDHKIQFTQEPTDNEGNFIAIIRLLAKSNPGLKDHLEHRPQNACYTSKTIQNEVTEVMADLIRDYFRQCLEKCPHFSLIADETTFHGREIATLDEICVPSEDERFECPGEGCQYSNIGKWTETHNEKLWAHFLFCVRDGHAGTNETTC